MKGRSDAPHHVKSDEDGEHEDREQEQERIASPGTGRRRRQLRRLLGQGGGVFGELGRLLGEGGGVLDQGCRVHVQSPFPVSAGCTTLPPRATSVPVTISSSQSMARDLVSASTSGVMKLSRFLA